MTAVMEREAVEVSAEEAEVYNAAADLIERQGWTQGAMIDNDRRLCVMGAVREVLWERGEYGVSRFVGLNDFRACVENNDKVGRTKEEAVAVLRNRAIRDGWSWD
jgi:hypothetical protein